MEDNLYTFFRGKKKENKVWKLTDLPASTRCKRRIENDAGDREPRKSGLWKQRKIDGRGKKVKQNKKEASFGRQECLMTPDERSQLNRREPQRSSGAVRLGVVHFILLHHYTCTTEIRERDTHTNTTPER